MDKEYRDGLPSPSMMSAEQRPTGEIQEMPSSSLSWNGGKCKALPLPVLAPCHFDVATRRELQAAAAV
jgi:hypothetical protein